ncbi:MAG: aminopeptidase [Oscillospiraceae bacterium]|nr:aminopeptidase [Oscillospiraceae bacterium]
MIIGITGGSGSGKTTLLNALKEYGFYLIDCDRVYHELLETSDELKRALGSAFPSAVNLGKVDRKALAAEVFSSDEALAKLNGITHPFVLRETDRRIARERERGVNDFAVDAVGLFEGGEAELCDITVAVTAPREDRVSRIMLRDGISRERAESRIYAQKSDEDFSRLCDKTVVNSYKTEAEFLAYLRGNIKSIITKGDIDMTEEKKNELIYKQKHLSDVLSADEKKLSDAYCERYKDFMAKAKTERLAVNEAVKLAEENGFREWDGKAQLKAGEKIYRNIRGKALFLAVIGEEPMEKGTHICAAHIDSPRIDLKQVPLFEKDEVAYFRTHYYGGIRKYQWVTIPLSLHGVVIKKDGESVSVSIGDDPTDPTFMISDLLPHLASKQGQLPLNQAITGENLSVIIGSCPVDDAEASDRFKLNVLSILNGKYGITEEDFLSAELEIVPGLMPRDVGLDRSLIAAYGHDDRVCAYAELAAILEVVSPKYTAVCVLADKEEIGSVGVTGMQSRAFENFMDDLCALDGSKLRHSFDNSLCISADVTNAFDPIYPEVSEKANNTRLNYGLGVCKFTGSRGKSGASDASAEVVGRVRKIFAENAVVWQTGELGKVDEGGGGTVAAYMANRGIDTIDAGVPVIAMHSPYEIVSKFDCYMCYKAMKAVYLEK